MDTPPPAVPPAEFDWRRYASATLAGLTPIIPLPLVDDVVESLLARRVPAAVADAHGQTLDPAVAALFKSSKTWRQRASGCLMTPVWFLIKLPLKLFKKLLIFLTVRSVANKLAEHWTRAYLIDVALRRGELEDPPTAARAVSVIDRLVAEADEPLVEAGKQVYRQLRQLPLRHWLRRAEAQPDAATQDEAAELTRERIRGNWPTIAAPLEARGRRYVQAMQFPADTATA